MLSRSSRAVNRNASMLAARLGACGASLRWFSQTTLRANRYSRESLRRRLGDKQKTDAPSHPHQQTPETTYYGDLIPVRPTSHLVRALGFTVAVGAGSYAVLSVANYERAKSLARSQFQKMNHFFKTEFKSWSSSDGYKEFTWADLSDGKKAAVALIASNILVTLLWRAKPLQPAMWRYFSNSFASKSLCAPMALSVFSHSSVIHLGLNMYVLWTFANASVDKFFQSWEHFAAFYLTAGVVSSWTSLAHKAVIRSPIRALGASGAIMGLLTYTCSRIPDAKLQVVFVPQLQFSAENAVYGLILFDVLGLLFRFKLFDHAAHLGGALFGVWYAHYGEFLMWGDYCDVVVNGYKKLRGEDKYGAMLHHFMEPRGPVGPHLGKAFLFTVGVGVGSYTVMSLVNDIMRPNPLERARIEVERRIHGLFDQRRMQAREGGDAAAVAGDDDWGWEELSDGRKCAIVVVGTSVAVEVLWHVKGMHRTMWRYFTNSLPPKSYWSMCLCGFAHSSPISLAFAALGMWNMADEIDRLFRNWRHFAAFYATASVVSSFSGLLSKAVMEFPGSTVGEGSALMAVRSFSYTRILARNDPVRKQFAYICILFDTLSVLMSLDQIDRAAQKVGAVLFGIWYAKRGEALLWGDLRRWIVGQMRM